MRPWFQRHAFAFLLVKERQIHRRARRQPCPLRYRGRSRLGCEQHQRPGPPHSRQRPAQGRGPATPRGNPHQGRSACPDRSATPATLSSRRTQGSRPAPRRCAIRLSAAFFFRPQRSPKLPNTLLTKIDGPAHLTTLVRSHGRAGPDAAAEGRRPDSLVVLRINGDPAHDAEGDALEFLPGGPGVG